MSCNFEQRWSVLALGRKKPLEAQPEAGQQLRTQHVVLSRKRDELITDASVERGLFVDRIDHPIFLNAVAGVVDLLLNCVVTDDCWAR